MSTKLQKYECPYCGRPVPDANMRCKNLMMCAERADFLYISNALGIKKV